MRVLVGPLPVDTMNCVSVERSDWTGCTENKVGSGPKLIVRGVAPLRRSVLFNTQYWTPRYDGFPPVHEEKSFAEMMTTRLLKPRSGWSAQPVIVETLYAFHRPAGSSDLETSSRTLPVVTSVIEVNQRPLAVSKWTFGSLMKSVDGTPKNVSSGKVCTSTPCFVEIRPRTFTISTTWFGPTATWTSGGVRRFVYGPLVPKEVPYNGFKGRQVGGVGPTGPAWVGPVRRVPGVAVGTIRVAPWSRLPRDLDALRHRSPRLFASIAKGLGDVFKTSRKPDSITFARNPGSPARQGDRGRTGRRPRGGLRRKWGISCRPSRSPECQGRRPTV